MIYVTYFISTLVGVILLRSLILSLTALKVGSKMDEGVVIKEDFNPKVTVLVPAYNEQEVIGDCLKCMNALEYADGQLEVVILNDRSKDDTREIIDTFINNHPHSHIRAIHRPFDAKPGKAAAMKEAIAGLESEIIIVFDADYMPSPILVKRLVAPFENPEVGATMGRVVTHNCNANILTRLIDLERRSGYTIDQNVRNYYDLLPQFGGTTGGIRLSALKAVGGWNTKTLTEDTDLTYRLYLNNYKIKYLNAAACFEETPEDWKIRYKQVRRWAYGHNDCLLRYFIPTLKHKDSNIWRKIDALIILLVYAAPSLLCLISLCSFFTASDEVMKAAYPVLFLILFSGLGNFAPFFQMLAACIYDKQPHCARYIPYLFVSSSVSLIASTHALLLLPIEKLGLKKALTWDKTVRFRKKAVV